MAALHETALMIMGIDNNVVPFGYDFLVPQFEYLKCRGAESNDAGRRFKVIKDGPITYRFWSKVGGVSFKSARLRPYRGISVLMPQPECILEVMPESPDFGLLREQYAYLAAVVHAEKMSDEEIEQFLTYVRRPLHSTL